MSRIFTAMTTANQIAIATSVYTYLVGISHAHRMRAAVDEILHHRSYLLVQVPA